LGLREIESLIERLNYQYYQGVGDNFFKGFKEIEVLMSAKGRIREIYGNGSKIAVVRLNDGFILPTLLGAEILRKNCPSPRLRVIVSSKVKDFIIKGRSVYSRHVVEVDENLRPGHEVIVVDEEDSLLAIGRLVLSPPEILSFKRGVAVKVRKSVGK